MKLRIQGDSLRLRVTRSELDALAERGFIEDEIRFSASSRLVYRLEMTENRSLEAEFCEGRVRVGLPQESARAWFAESEVSVRGSQPLCGGQRLEILVEKDFACLVPREGEDSGDFFPNPQAPRAS